MKVRSTSDTCIFYSTSHAHSASAIGLLTGEAKSEQVSKYIACSRFRATTKAMTLGNLLDLFDSTKVFLLEFLSCLCLYYLYITFELIQQIVFIIEYFVLDVQAHPQHQTLPCLNNDMQVFGFMTDILLPKVCTCVHMIILTKSV